MPAVSEGLFPMDFASIDHFPGGSIARTTSYPAAPGICPYTHARPKFDREYPRGGGRGGVVFRTADVYRTGGTSPNSLYNSSGS